MGSRNGYDADLELDEIQNVVDRGSGAVSIAQRQLNAQQNLGLASLVGGASGGAQLTQVDAESYDIQAANFALQNVNTAQQAFNATANGAITLAVGVYAFELNLNLTNTGTTSHTWAILFGGTAVLGTGSNISGAGASGTTAGTPVSGSLMGFTTTPGTAMVMTAASTSATEQVNIQALGILNVTTAGTLIPQVKLSAAPGGTQTNVAGSFFRIWKLPSTGALGNWS